MMFDISLSLFTIIILLLPVLFPEVATTIKIIESSIVLFTSLFIALFTLKGAYAKTIGGLS